VTPFATIALLATSESLARPGFELYATAQVGVTVDDQHRAGVVVSVDAGPAMLPFRGGGPELGLVLEAQVGTAYPFSSGIGLRGGYGKSLGYDDCPGYLPAPRLVGEAIFEANYHASARLLVGGVGTTTFESSPLPVWSASFVRSLGMNLEPRPGFDGSWVTEVGLGPTIPFISSCTAQE